MRDLVGKPVAWGARAPALTFCRATCSTGSGSTGEGFQGGLSRPRRRRAGDGARRARRRAVGRRHRLAGLSTAVMQAGGRFIGLTPRRARASAPSTIPQADHGAGGRLSGAGPGRVGRIVELHPGAAHARRRRGLSPGAGADHGHAALVERLAQGRETTPRNTLAAAPSPEQIHPGVQRYLREIGLTRLKPSRPS